MARNLVLTGGPPSHDWDSLAATVVATLERESITSEVMTDLGEFGRRVADPLRRPDVITVLALRFTMSHPRYDRDRESWAMATDPAFRDAIDRFVNTGGGLLALHTACVCFDDWPSWGTLLGASWDWERSSHDPVGDALIEPTEIHHPITDGVEAFTVNDEIYEGLAPRSHFRTLLACERGGGVQPVVWARTAGTGRVVVDTIGHTPVTLDHPAHQLVLRRSARWVLGHSDDAVRGAGGRHAIDRTSDQEWNTP